MQPAHGGEQRAEKQGEMLLTFLYKCTALPVLECFARTVTSKLCLNIIFQLMQYEPSPEDGATQ